MASQINVDRMLSFVEDNMRELDKIIFSIKPELNVKQMTVKDGLILKRQFYESLYSFLLKSEETNLDFEKINNKINSDAKTLLEDLQ